MLGDADVLPFKRNRMTKKPALEMFPIVKVDEYNHGAVEKTYYLVRKPDGTEVFHATYAEAAAYQLENRP